VTKALSELRAAVVSCRRCPRLVAWRERVAREKRAAFADEEYWGRPVPGFGDPEARIVVVGLAPAAHGANRTGRMFTGDRSGDWLYGALHRAGFASGAEARARDDGLTLSGVYVTAAVRCAPPGNRPTTGERDACRPFLEAEVDHFLAPAAARGRVLVALGGFAWDSLLRVLSGRGRVVPVPKPRFAHGAEVGFPGSGGSAGRGDGPPTGEGDIPLLLLGSYHPSQQNTFTGRLTEPMFDTVWRRAREAAYPGTEGPGSP